MRLAAGLRQDDKSDKEYTEYHSHVAERRKVLYNREFDRFITNVVQYCSA